MNAITPADLPRLADRTPYAYLEHCTLSRADGGVVATDEDGETAIPVADLALVMLGPGTRVTHGAVSLIFEAGAAVVWTGEQGVRCYAYGDNLAGSTRLLETQARLVSSERSRLALARRMYSMRFPGEDLTGLTMRQLLGREGLRVADAYRREAKRVGVAWHGRVTGPDATDAVNRALSGANAALYGVVRTAILALGCSPALGFVHCGHRESFTFDIADLYKTETSIPIAFDLNDRDPDKARGIARRMMRDRLADGRILRRCVTDITTLFSDVDDPTQDDLSIWKGGSRFGKAGHDYGHP